jgi:putative lipoprotein
VPASGVPSTGEVMTGSVPAQGESPVGIWCVASVGSQPVDGVVATVEFTADGQVQGSGGVNNFTGPYQVVEGQIEFGPLISTLMAGPEPAAEVERRLFAVLAGSQPFVIDGDVLTLGGDDGAVLRRVSTSTPELVIVSGTVTYRERIALPEDAVLVVWVDDMATGDPSPFIAQVTITVTNQVPIAYAVAIDRTKFQLDRQYWLMAEITVGDTVWFRSTGDHAVLAEPESQTINVLLSQA